MQIFDEFWGKLGFSSKIIKILSNDVIHHIHVCYGDKKYH